MSGLEIGLSMLPAPPAADLQNILQAERDGFDYALFGESQNRFADPFVRMAAAAPATRHIGLAAICTPPGTRHPAVTAAAAVSLQARSAGRFVLGLGRGDSSLKLLGRPFPAPLAEFAEVVKQVKGYLGGEGIQYEGYSSRLDWIPDDLPPVPIEIPCTGPRTIAFAATVADRLSFAVGKSPERIEWALSIARSAAEDAGRDPDSLQFGAYVNTTITDDVERACELLRGKVAGSASFSAMRDSPVDGHPDVLRRVTEQLKRATVSYDRELRDCVDSEFVRWWTAIGSSSEVVAALRSLVKLGLGHLYLINGDLSLLDGSRDTSLTDESRSRLVAEVLPALRR